MGTVANLLSNSSNTNQTGVDSSQLQTLYSMLLNQNANQGQNAGLTSLLNQGQSGNNQMGLSNLMALLNQYKGR